MVLSDGKKGDYCCFHSNCMNFATPSRASERQTFVWPFMSHLPSYKAHGNQDALECAKCVWLEFGWHRFCSLPSGIVDHSGLICRQFVHCLLELLITLAWFLANLFIAFRNCWQGNVCLIFDLTPTECVFYTRFDPMGMCVCSGSWLKNRIDSMRLIIPLGIFPPIWHFILFMLIPQFPSSIHPIIPITIGVIGSNKELTHRINLNQAKPAIQQLTNQILEK
jgi:hypothetical protein